MFVKLAMHLRLMALGKLDLSSRSVAVSEAMIFQYILENMPVYHNQTNRLKGDCGFSSGARDKTEAFIRDNPVSPREQEEVRSAEELQLQNEFFCKGIYTLAHTCVNYEKVVSRGIKGILDDVAAEKQAKTGTHLDYLTAMEIALNSFIRFAGRFGVDYVPLNPARNFPEALQCIWLVHLVISISEYNSASISLGRIDQYAYDCFMKSDEKESELWFDDFLDKINSYGDAACNVNLGGVDPDGNDLCNELSYFIARRVKKKLMPSPILSARIHSGFPQELFDTLIDPDLFRIGQPTFYGEKSCLKALERRGIPEADTHKWAANSCMGLIIQGHEVSDMWGVVVSSLLPLELALNNGKPFEKELFLELQTQPCGRYDDFEALYRQFIEYWHEVIDFCIEANRKSTERYAKEFINPYVSTLLDDCVARGEDRVVGGSRYYNVITEAFALVNAADALFTIKKMVFEEGKYSLAELVTAAKNNFANQEELYGQIIRLPKYGDGEAEADAMAARLARDFVAKVGAYSNEKIAYAPSCHTLNSHVPAGKLYAASLDGRTQGAPFAKNGGTSLGLVRKDLTSLFRSAVTIDQSEFFGGQPIDISLDTRLIDTIGGKRKFQQLLQTYFEMGGLQVQVNGLTAEDLKKAVDAPDKYDDLIVRIGGYSTYFNHLTDDIKIEMINRFSSGT